MSGYTRRLTGVMAVFLFLFAASGACAHFGTGGEGEEEARDRDVRSEGGALILTGSALEDGTGTVLGTMTGKVPNFRVKRHAGNCPEIMLRNHVSFQSVSNPHVYVDGTRATDTCILESLRAEDVERIEVYPQGFTTRPGYGTHAHGLILVFMRIS